MENVSSSSNHTITASSFVPCPRLPELAQWRKEYLTPVVFYNSVAVITINGLLLPVTTILNALIMISILVDRQLRRNPCMIMLLSLSATDFLIGFLVQPIFIVGRVSELLGRLDLVCIASRLQSLTGVACVGTSLCHTCLISVERYLVVRFPNRYKDILSNRRVVSIVLLIWLFMTTYAVLPYVGLVKGNNFNGRSVIVVLVIVVTAAFYIATFRETFTAFPRLNISPAPSGVSPGVPSLSCSEEAKYGPGRAKTIGCASRNSSDNFINASQSLSSDGKFLQSSTNGLRIDQISGTEKSDKTTISPIADQFLANDGKFHQSSTSGVRVDQKYRKEGTFDNKVRQLGQLSATATSSTTPNVYIPSHSHSQGSKFRADQLKNDGRTSGSISNDSRNVEQFLSYDEKFLQPYTSEVRVGQTSRKESKSVKVINSKIANKSMSYDGKFLQPSTSGISMDQSSRMQEEKADKFINKARALDQLSAAALRRKMREKKLAKTLFITVGFLALCYFPEMMANPFVIKGKEEMASNWIVFSWTKTLLYFNSFVNPFWYSWRMPRLRKAVLKLVMRR